MQDKVVVDFYKEKAQISNLKKENAEKVEKIKNFDYLQTEEEKELYKKFCDIANADPHQKFKFEHVEKLGVNADVVVIYGKKGIGKTYQISKIIHELAETDPKAEVVLIRNTISEFAALEKQLSVDYCPIYLKGRTTNLPRLFHKTHLRGGKPRCMGFCTALTGFALESAKGAEYPNTRLIIWDECTNIGAGNSYDSSDIARFITFFDSIIRNKQDVKIYIFGNFHRNTDGKVSDVLLDTLKIPYGCTLKKRKVTSKNGKNESTFLYINTGSLYSGIDNNAKISLFGEQIQEDLLSNIPRSYSNMVGGLNVFYGHTPKWGLVFNDGEETFILLLSSFKTQIDFDTWELNWMVHMEKFPTENVFVHTLYTVSSSLFNQFGNYDLKMIDRHEKMLLIYDLYQICLKKSLYYSSDVTMGLFNSQMTKWQEKYDFALTTTSFFPKGGEKHTIWF